MQVSIQYDKNGIQKSSVKIESRDLWSGDVTLAQIIYPFLKKYRNLYKGNNSMCGYPASFAANPYLPEGPENQDHFNEWLICLDKMIYSFGWIANQRDWDGPEVKNLLKECDILLKPYRKELKKLTKQDKERFAALESNGALNSLEWDRKAELVSLIYKKYFPLFDSHRAKIQEGIDLFAKHFGSFWI